MATADRYQPEQRKVDGYELEATFIPLDRVVTLPLSLGDHVFWMAATQTTMRGDRST